MGYFSHVTDLFSGYIVLYTQQKMYREYEYHPRFRTMEALLVNTIVHPKMF